MQTRLLSEKEFRRTFVPPMRNISGRAIGQPDEPGIEGGVIDIWPYVDEIPESNLQGHNIQKQVVEYVSQSSDDRWDHVLIPTKTRNVYLVVVVDVPADLVYGHILLDLNKKYGIEPPSKTR
jgi:hypothetical protein